MIIHIHTWRELNPPGWRNLWAMFRTDWGYICDDCEATKWEDAQGRLTAYGGSGKP